jgi:hypothetical protein
MAVLILDLGTFSAYTVQQGTRKRMSIPQLPLYLKLTLFYKRVQLVTYADDINIIGRRKEATSEVYEALNVKAN